MMHWSVVKNDGRKSEKEANGESDSMHMEEMNHDDQGHNH